MTDPVRPTPPEAARSDSRPSASTPYASTPSASVPSPTAPTRPSPAPIAPQPSGAVALGTAPQPARGAKRSAEVRLARLHLRGGMLALARAELEQLAGSGGLDVDALADLAEAR